MSSARDKLDKLYERDKLNKPDKRVFAVLL